MANGVNISDITRTFSDQEWASLSSENRRHVHEERERRRNTTEDLLGRFMQPQLLLPSQTDLPSLLTKNLPLTTKMEELAKLLALVTVPIMAVNVEEDEDVLVGD